MSAAHPAGHGLAVIGRVIASIGLGCLVVGACYLLAAEQPAAFATTRFVMLFAKAAAMLFVLAAAMTAAAKFLAGSVGTNRGDGTTRLSG